MAPATPAQAVRKLGILIAVSVLAAFVVASEAAAQTVAEIQAMVEKLYQTPEPLAWRTREILGTE
jgi:hypothetical protein